MKKCTCKDCKVHPYFGATGPWVKVEGRDFNERQLIDIQREWKDRGIIR